MPDDPKPDDATPDATPDDATPDATPDDATPDDAALALAEVKALRDEAAKARKALKEREARIAELERVGLNEQERAVADARRETEQQVRAEYDAKLRVAALRAAGAGALHDPEDAVRYIDVDELGDDETRWGERAQRAVDKLLDERDYLRANGDTPAARGLISGGGRGSQGSGQPKDESEWLRKAARKR